jgi:hypothetical protein
MKQAKYRTLRRANRSSAAVAARNQAQLDTVGVAVDLPDGVKWRPSGKAPNIRQSLNGRLARTSGQRLREAEANAERILGRKRL